MSADRAAGPQYFCEVPLPNGSRCVTLNVFTDFPFVDGERALQGSLPVFVLIRLSMNAMKSKRECKVHHRQTHCSNRTFPISEWRTPSRTPRVSENETQAGRSKKSWYGLEGPISGRARGAPEPRRQRGRLRRPFPGSECFFREPRQRRPVVRGCGSRARGHAPHVDALPPPVTRTRRKARGSSICPPDLQPLRDLAD